MIPQGYKNRDMVYGLAYVAVFVRIIVCLIRIRNRLREIRENRRA